MSLEFPNRDPHEKLVEETITMRIHNLKDWPTLYEFANGKLIFWAGGDTAWFYNDVLKTWEEKPYTATQDMKNSSHTYYPIVGPDVFAYLESRFG